MNHNWAKFESFYIIGLCLKKYPYIIPTRTNFYTMHGQPYRRQPTTGHLEPSAPAQECERDEARRNLYTTFGPLVIGFLDE